MTLEEIKQRTEHLITYESKLDDADISKLLHLYSILDLATGLENKIKLYQRIYQED